MIFFQDNKLLSNVCVTCVTCDAGNIYVTLSQWSMFLQISFVCYNNIDHRIILEALRVTFESILNIYFIFFQLGIAIGFLLPPVIVRNHDDLDLVGQDLQLMFYLIAGFTTVLVVLVALCEFFNCILYFNLNFD